MITKEEVLKALDTMTVLEIIALTKQLEKEWGVEAKPAPVQAQKQKEPDAPPQTEFNVMLISVPSDKKMAVIKVVRDLVRLGLKESKDLVEAAPKLIKEGVDAKEAETVRLALVEAGAVVEIK